MKFQAHNQQSQELIQLLENHLEFTQWGFVQSYVSLTDETLPFIIYDSEWCRIKFSLRWGEAYRGNEMKVSYGRLHASNTQSFIVWNGKECRCWHNAFEILYLLDGFSPQDAVERLRRHDKWPVASEKFRRSDIGKQLSREYHPEWMTRLQAAIWEHYGERLFEMFDLRKPDLWEGYVHYVKEYFQILGISSDPRAFGNEDLC